jgi:hypothetical protein
MKKMIRSKDLSQDIDAESPTRKTKRNRGRDGVIKLRSDIFDLAADFALSISKNGVSGCVIFTFRPHQFANIIIHNVPKIQSFSQSNFVLSFALILC